MADRAKFLDFLDMIDGGGAGQRGNQFEGGGIFSALANLMPINPFGSEDPTRRRARDEFFAEQGITPEQAAATPAVIRALPFDAGPITSDMRPQLRPVSEPVGSGRGVMGMPMQGSGRGAMGMPMPPSAPAGSGRGAMGMPMPVRDPNAELARFNQMMETIPMELRSSISQQMYRDYLLNGGTAAFPDYMKGM